MKIPNIHPLVWQCGLLAFLGFAFELVYSAYTLFLVSRQTTMAVLLSLLTPFFALAGQHWFVEAPTFRKRVLLTLATGVGYAIGTWVATRFF